MGVFAAPAAAWDGWVGTIETAVVSDQVLTNSITHYSRSSVVTLTSAGSRTDTSRGTGFGSVSSTTTYPNATVCGQLKEERSRADGPVVGTGDLPIEVAIVDSPGGYQITGIQGGQVQGTYTQNRVGGAGCPFGEGEPQEAWFPVPLGPLFVPDAEITDPNRLEYSLTRTGGNCGPGCSETSTVTVNLTREPATIEVIKRLDPETDPGRFDLFIDDTVVAPAAGDGATSGPVPVAPGSHTVSEASALGTNGMATALGNYSTTISCLDTATGTVLEGTGTALTVTVEAGDAVRCTITSVLARATITIDKVTDPLGDETAFDFTSTLPGAGSFVLRDADPALTVTVPAGTYSVTEHVPAGWLLDSLVCSDPDSTVTGSTATLDVVAGEAVTCTFTNELSVLVVDAGYRFPVVFPARSTGALTGFSYATVSGSPEQLADIAYVCLYEQLTASARLIRPLTFGIAWGTAGTAGEVGIPRGWDIAAPAVPVVRPGDPAVLFTSTLTRNNGTSCYAARSAAQRLGAVVATAGRPNQMLSIAGDLYVEIYRRSDGRGSPSWSFWVGKEVGLYRARRVTVLDEDVTCDLTARGAQCEELS
jgi:hypothetical protein